MSHLPGLITDLALILISAGITTLIFKWLKQPLVLGYIVAGVLAGPYFHLFPTVADSESITIWAEIGVVFLLFSLGLEFSFKKLVNVGSSALITAITEVICMLLIGFSLGQILGWTTMDSLFLGGMLSMSSTTIIIKAFDDLGLRNQKFTSIVFGTLVVEDLVAILMMVMLSTLSVSQHFVGEAMVGSLLKLGFFLILWFLVGIYILPSFLKKVKPLMNDETLLIIALGLCLGMVVLATYTGFSAALGAFIMGSILAETIEGKRIEHLIKGLKDFFGAVFFVSVGMMVDPEVLYKYAVPVLVISLVTIIGKSLFSSFGVLLSGKSLKISIQSGFSLAQIGEFAFIIASLGYSLGVISEFIYPIIVAVSVITTFTTPYFIRISEPFYLWLSRHLPKRVLDAIERYSSGSKTVNHESEWKALLKSISLRILMYSVMLTAIILASFNLLLPFLLANFSELIAVLFCAIITILAMIPFLHGLLDKGVFSELFQKLWNDNKFNRGGLVSLILFQISVAVFFVCIVLFKLFDFNYLVVIIIALIVVLMVFILRKLLRRHSKMEARFFENLNHKEEDRKNKPLTTGLETHLFNQDIHLSKITVSADSFYVGKTLATSSFKKDFGINVVKILRGSKQINLPGGAEFIYPQDKLVVLGTDEQINHFMNKIEKSVNEYSDSFQKEMTLRSFTIEENSRLIGHSILDSGIREATGFLVIGIERDNHSLMNPDIYTIFQIRDLVWVVGEEENIHLLEKIANTCN